MEKLKSKLWEDLAGNPDLSILNAEIWQLPVVSYDVSFNRVKRLKMDILMKMLLLAFQDSDIRRAATLSEMLFVEELFIRDLIEKMQRTQLIQLEKSGYQLTPKGTDYLEKGIFEEEMEANQTLVSYSAVHDDYRLSKTGADPEMEKELPLYRYAAEGIVDNDRIYELLSNEKSSVQETFQIIVTEIVNCEEHSTEFIPCIEFQLYDQKKDIFYSRVWNTMMGSWDGQLEKQIEEREVVEWREAMEKGQSRASIN